MVDVVRLLYCGSATEAEAVDLIPHAVRPAVCNRKHSRLSVTIIDKVSFYASPTSD